MEFTLRFSAEKLKLFELRKAIDYYANERILERMSITGYLPNSAWDNPSLNRIRQNFKNGNLIRKDHTWWLVFRPLPMEIIESVAIRFGDNYLECSFAEAEKILAEES